MFASFLLSLREGLEAALIIGIVLAALRKMGRSNLSFAVWQGVLVAIAASVLAGMALNWLGAEFEGRAEVIFEGTAMLVAAVLLTWMVVWMSRQSAGMQAELEAGVRKASAGEGNRWALFGLALLAIGREGFELVLFLTAVQMTANPLQAWLGAVLGLASAVALGWLFFASTKRLSLRQFFRVTNLLLVLFAAGLVAHGVHEFNEAGVIPAGIEHVWNVNPILDEKATVGQLLTALFGYNGNPSLTEILAYILYLLGITVLWKRTSLAAVVKTAG